METITVKLGEMLSKSRNSCARSQRYMAKVLQKSLGTIQSYENGLSSPSVSFIAEWFTALGLNPLPYLLEVLCPDVHSKLFSDTCMDNVRQAVVDYFENIATDREICELAYSIFGNTGSSWKSQLDMLTAHNHVPLDRRINVAQTVLDNYELCEATDTLIGKEHIMPDIDKLKSAINNAKKSAYLRLYGYANFKRKEQNETYYQ